MGCCSDVAALTRCESVTDGKGNDNMIYVKDNVERITDDERVAKRLLAEGYKAVAPHNKAAVDADSLDEAAGIQRRRRQRRTPNTEAE